ncbi:hypothetical protein EZS27_013677 [termite gut metagenome]|uniref:HAD family phosphatase n=1 Tax=termite gut metagenome TaxID=433724 RepID=A0A5J4RZ16_9ZZZZ
MFGERNWEFNKLITSDSALFFDMDGTLIDTDYANFLSYKKAIELVLQKDFDLPHNPTQRFNRSLLRRAIPNLTEKELEMIICEKEKCYSDFLSETQLNSEIVEVLFNYYTTNKTVLVTNCRKDRALATLSHHGLTNKFSDFFFRQIDDKEKVNKFQNAILKMSMSPNLIIAFENEDDEIADAIIAGIQYINPKL